MRRHLDGDQTGVGQYEVHLPVLADQFTLMHRCGINAFAVNNAAARKALETGAFKTVNLFYQPVGVTEVPVGTRPFLRRPAEAETEDA